MKILLPIDGQLLAQATAYMRVGAEIFSPRAQEYGITREALDGWIKAERIPPRALAELGIEFGWSAEITRLILRKPPVRKKLDRRCGKP